MSETLTAPTDARLEILPSGIRLVRLGPGDEGWLHEYRRILLVAASDFLRRAELPGVPEAVLERLRLAVSTPHSAVWLVLDPAYRLIGFAWITVSSLFGGPPIATAPAVYLYPRKASRAAFPALVRRMSDWAHAAGADVACFETRRRRTRAWARIGARPASTIYEVSTGVKEAAHGLEG